MRLKLTTKQIERKLLVKPVKHVNDILNFFDTWQKVGTPPCKAETKYGTRMGNTLL